MKDLKINSRLGSTPREISFADDRLFITPDNDAVDRMLQKTSKISAGGLLHRLESHLPLIAASTLAVVAFIWLIYTWGIPRAADMLVMQLPESVVQSQGSFAALDEILFAPSELDYQRQQQLHRLLAPYLAPYAHLNARLHFRSVGTPNAFALPDGSIVIADELVTKLDNAEQLVAVLHHEIGHLHHRHIIRNQLRNSMVTMVLLLISGGVGGDLLSDFPGIMADLSYSREFELEADSFALEHLCAYGISPQHFVDLFNHLDPSFAANNRNSRSGANLVLDLFVTHPPSQERARLLSQCPLDT